MLWCVGIMFFIEFSEYLGSFSMVWSGIRYIWHRPNQFRLLFIEPPCTINGRIQSPTCIAQSMQHNNNLSWANLWRGYWYKLPNKLFSLLLKALKCRKIGPHSMQPPLIQTYEIFSSYAPAATDLWYRSFTESSEVKAPRWRRCSDIAELCANNLIKVFNYTYCFSTDVFYFTSKDSSCPSSDSYFLHDVCRRR